MQPTLSVWDQHEDKKGGGRMITFVSSLVTLPDGKQVGHPLISMIGGTLLQDCNESRNLF